MNWIDAVITPLIAVVCSAITGFCTWLFSRKKYNTEVEHNTIDNMDNSLEFYEKLSNSNKKMLEDILTKYEEVVKSNLELISEIQNLKCQVDILVRIIRVEVSDIDFEKYGIQINPDGTLSRVEDQEV